MDFVQIFGHESTAMILQEKYLNLVSDNLSQYPKILRSKFRKIWHYDTQPYPILVPETIKHRCYGVYRLFAYPSYLSKICLYKAFNKWKAHLKNDKIKYLKI